MEVIVFWIIYVFGGTCFLFFTFRANKLNKTDGDPLWGEGSVLYTLPLIYRGEIIWVICWLLGVLVYRSQLSYLVGILPLLMPILTFASILVVNINWSFRKDMRLKYHIKKSITNWSGKLPIGYKIRSVDYSLQGNLSLINGRIIVYLSSRKEIDKERWDYLGDSLKREIQHPVIVQIKLNGIKVYPK